LLVGLSPARQECPHCGQVQANDDTPAFYRPWHVRSRQAVWAYLESLGSEAHEWLLALYVDNGLNLLAVETLAQGSISACPAPFWKVYRRGYALGAKGFILAHNHPSGDPRPSQADRQLTNHIRMVSRDADMPLLDHLIVTKDDIYII
jgi:DNA repair protein RadC